MITPTLNTSRNLLSVPEREVELRVGKSSEYHYGRYKRRGFFSEKATGGGSGGRGGTFKFL